MYWFEKLDIDCIFFPSWLENEQNILVPKIVLGTEK